MNNIQLTLMQIVNKRYNNDKCREDDEVEPEPGSVEQAEVDLGRLDRELELHSSRYICGFPWREVTCRHNSNIPLQIIYIVQ